MTPDAEALCPDSSPALLLTSSSSLRPTVHGTSPDYGKVVRTVPLPPPGNVGNEPHHCHLSADGNVLACGGLLSVLRGQNDIFFFDVAQANDPKLIKSTRATHASIIDDFYPLPGGGFLVTGMGSETGGAPGRILEFDPSLNL